MIDKLINSDYPQLSKPDQYETYKNPYHSATESDNRWSALQKPCPVNHAPGMIPEDCTFCKGTGAVSADYEEDTYYVEEEVNRWENI